MKHVVFIRSYSKDFEWLKFCLRSIEKFVTGHDAVVVTVPHADLPMFLPMLKAAGVNGFGVHETMPGYCQQQVDKIYADEFCGAGDPWITFFDSDCVATAPFDLKTLFAANGKPYQLYTAYASLGKSVPWQSVTERCLGFPCEHETMRRHPLTYRASELRAFRQWFRDIRGQRIDEYVRGVQANAFSEFNALGSWLWQFHHGDREWVNTEGGNTPQWPLKQFWSWSSVTPEVRAEIERILA